MWDRDMLIVQMNVDFIHSGKGSGLYYFNLYAINLFFNMAGTYTICVTGS